MAQILRFSSPAVTERETILNEIRRLALACNVTWEQITFFACGKDKTWEDMPLDFLYGPLNLLRAELAEKESKAAQAAVLPTHSAHVIPFVSQGLPEESARMAAKRISADMQAAADYRDSVVTVVPTKPSTHALSEAEAIDKAARREAHRKMMITKVHVALPELYGKLEGFNEDTYRFLLQERWGVDSSTRLTNEQLHSLLVHLQRLGWDAKWRKTERGKRDKRPATLQHDTSGLGRTGLMGKIEAMLAEKGAAEGTNIPWGYAVGILKRQTGGVVTRFEDALPVQLSAVIAALHRDAKRKGRRAR